MPLVYPGSGRSSPDIIVPDHIPLSFHILYRKRARIAFNDAKYEAEELARKLASESQKLVTEEVAAINPLDSWDDVFEDCETKLALDPVKSTTDTTSIKDVYAALKEAVRSLSANKQKFLETVEEAPACRVSTAAKVVYDFETYNTVVGNFAKEAGQRYATSLAPSKHNDVHNSTRGAPSNDVVAPETLKTIGRCISDLSVSGPKPSSAVSEKMVRQPEVDNQNGPNQHTGPSENPMFSTDSGLHHPSACNSSSGVEIIHPQPVRCISTSIETFEVSAQPNTTSPEEFSEPTTTAADKSAQSAITQEVVNDLPPTNIMREMEEVLQPLKEPVGLTVAGVGIAEPNALEKIQHDTSSQEITLNTSTNKSEGHLTSFIKQPIRSSSPIVPMTREVQIPQPCSEVGIAPIEEHNLQKVVLGTSRTVPEFGYQDCRDGSHLSIGAGSDEASSVGRVTQVDSVKIGRPSSTVIGNAGDSVGRPESELPARNPKKPATEGSSNGGINWPDPHPEACSPEVFQSWEDYDARKGDISIFPHYIEENRVCISNESGNKPYFNETIYYFGKVVQSIIPRPGENRPPLRVYPSSNPAPVVDHSVPVVDRHPERKSSIPTKTRRVKPPKVTSRAYQETLQIDSKGVVHPGRWNPYLRRFEILSRYNMREPDGGLDFNGHKRRRGRSFNGSPLPGVPTRNCDHLEFKDVDAIGGPGKWSSSESGQSNLEPRGGAEVSAPENDNFAGKSSAESANENCKTEEAREPLKLARENLSVGYPSLDKIISGFLKTLNKNFPDIPESDNLTEDDYPFTHPVDPKTIPVRQKYRFTKSGHFVWDDHEEPSITEKLASTEAEELAQSSGVSLPEVLASPKTEKSVEKGDRSAEVSVPSKAEEPTERSGESPPEVSASPQAENSVKEDQLLPKVLVPPKTEKLVEEVLAPPQTEKSVEKENQSPQKILEPPKTVKSVEEALAPPKAEGSVGKEDQSPPKVPEPPKVVKLVEGQDQSPPEVFAPPKTEEPGENSRESSPKVPEPSKIEKLVEGGDQSPPETLASPKTEESGENSGESPPKFLGLSKIEKPIEASAPPKTEKSVGKEDQSPPEGLEPLKTEKSAEKEDQSPPKAWARINGVWVSTTEKVTYVIAPRIPEYMRQQDQKV